MRFRDYFQNEFETNDIHFIPSLRTHYYRCRNENAMQAVNNLAIAEKAVVKHYDVEHHEITFETSRYTATATIISPHIGETAVDFKVLTYYLLPFGKGIKIIEKLYRELDNLLKVKS